MGKFYIFNTSWSPFDSLRQTFVLKLMNLPSCGIDSTPGVYGNTLPGYLVLLSRFIRIETHKLKFINTPHYAQNYAPFDPQGP